MANKPDRSYPDRPFVAVGVVVLHKDRVLLVKRTSPPNKDRWSLPGGAQEVGETVVEAAKREVREETGLDVEIVGLIDVIDLVDEDNDGGVRHHYTLVEILARSDSNAARPMDDVDELSWFDSHELPKLDLWPETARIIDAGLRMVKDA